MAELASQSSEAVRVPGLKIRGWCLLLVDATESFGAGKVGSLKNGYEKLQRAGSNPAHVQQNLASQDRG